LQIISRLYEDTEIDFFSENIDSIYINATSTAKAFGKKPETFLKTKQTKEYINALKSATGIKNLVIVKKGGVPKEQGTWIHKKLIIAFARWLNPYFAVWCDQQIEEILIKKYQTPITPPQKFEPQKVLADTKASIELIREVFSCTPFEMIQLDLDAKKRGEVSPIEHFNIDLSDVYLLPTELGKLIGKSAIEVNQLLAKSGYQTKVNSIWQLTKEGRGVGVELHGKFTQIKWRVEAIL
jgi:hypothetical protein